MDRFTKFLVGIVALVTTAQVSAGVVRDDKGDTDWEFILTPYLWAISLNGTSQVGPFPPLDIDADFGDLQWLRTTIDVTVDAILAQHKAAQFLFVESADPDSHAHGVIDSAFDNVARRMQAWCETRYGESPERECFKGLLVAAQWLVHNAIVSGLGEADVAQAKRAMEQLFHATFSGLDPSGK